MKLNSFIMSCGISRWMRLVLAALFLFVFVQWFWPEPAASLRWQANWSSGEYWRLISCHFVHLSLNHAALNIAGLLLLWLLFAGDWKPGVDVVLMAVSLPLTGLLLGAAGYAWYLGFSAVLHGWFLLGAFRVWPRQRLFAILLLSALAFKLFWESGNPASELEVAFIGGPIAYDSHKIGAVVSLFLWAIVALWSGIRR